jgi:hypothetical protein
MEGGGDAYEPALNSPKSTERDLISLSDAVCRRLAFINSGGGWRRTSAFCLFLNTKATTIVNRIAEIETYS